MYEIIETESREQWLAERRKRVTATDIGRLANGGPAMFYKVRAEKQGFEDFIDNRYIRWGKEREPAILDHLTFLKGIQPNNNLYVSGDRAATPDGISEDAIAEVKTTVRPWDTVEELRAQMPRYYDQTQWGMLVTEHEKCWFAFEYHENFIPIRVEHYLIPRDEERIQELLEVEEQFREYLDTPDESDEWTRFMAKYAIAEAEMKEKTAVVEAMKEEFRKTRGDKSLAVDTMFGKISYSKPKPRETFDTKTFKESHAELAKKFTKLVEPKQLTLRITPRGAKNE